MSDEKRIEEILARHLHEEGSCSASMLCPQTHEDRADLLIFISRHREEIQRLREELQWYADPRNHVPIEIRRPGDPDPAVVFVKQPPIMLDGGERARNALEGKP
jgi:hypothetical protein